MLFPHASPVVSLAAPPFSFFLQVPDRRPRRRRAGAVHPQRQVHLEQDLEPLEAHLPKDLRVALKHKEPIDNLDHGKFCEALAENILGEKLNKWLKSNGFEHIASQSIKKSAKIDKKSFMKW